jgi:bcr-type benzoyl-CoA reductase subunit C
MLGRGDAEVESRSKSETLEEFIYPAKTLFNSYLEDWKNQGGKVLGYFCSFVPPEIISAAGLLPVRIRATGNKGTELSDAYMASLSCSFSRSCLNMALEGGYDFLDGIIFGNSCDQVRRLHDIWKRKMQVPFIKILSIPRKTGDDQVQWYRDELASLRQELGNHFGVEISDDCIRKSIRMYNETRHLQKRVFNLLKVKNPPIKGSEVLSILVTGTAIPIERYNALLKEYLDAVSKVESSADARPRLMLLGSILDNSDYVKVIEDVGAHVVAASHCFAKAAWKDVVDDPGDPLLALARSCIAEQPYCPRMFGVFPKTAAFLKSMVKEFKADGVIGERMQFCDPSGFLMTMLKDEFKKENIPFLELDREYVLGGIGQMRTRVQAFLETLEGGK